MNTRIKQMESGTRSDRRGFALVPALLLVSGMAVFMVALLTATTAGNRSITYQADDFKISTAVETAAILSIEGVWSDYLTYVENVSADGHRTIGNFRAFMDSEGMPDQRDEFDINGDGIVDIIPGPEDGKNLVDETGLPVRKGRTQINNVNIDSLSVVRMDFNDDSTQIFLTVSASTTRGEGLVNPVRNRAVQQVYTIEPDEFNGFEYALLTNNVNCIFCHTNVDSAERYYNDDPNKSFERVRVGTLENLMVRHNEFDGFTGVINDNDADSQIAGAIYARGNASLTDGTPILDWSELSFKGYDFEYTGGPYPGTIEDPLSIVNLDPASLPHGPGDNLYLDYADEYSQQTDGNMPNYFPPPIPDDGGLDPLTGLPDPAAIGNRIIDDAEFSRVATAAQGSITAGNVNVTAPGDSISNTAEFIAAVLGGNSDSIQQTVDGNVILTGTRSDPLTINGTVAIDGDLIIQGWVRGEGSIIVRGNVYIPGDLTYYDDVVNGERTFGLTPNGERNALGLAAGGNIIIGDYQRPITFQPIADPLLWNAANRGYSIEVPGKFETISGNPGDKFNFALVEMALFNRGEWARTQPLLPGIGEDNSDPSTWTAVNPGYDPAYTPRYYSYGEDSIIPIHNKPRTSFGGQLYFDPVLNTWLGDEAAIEWTTEQLTYLDPTDPTQAELYDQITGESLAVIKTISPDDNWIADNLYQLDVEAFHDNRGLLTDLPLTIDALLYTNNAIFSMVFRDSAYDGRMVLNGSIVASDIGMLTPGTKDPGVTGNQSPQSAYQIGLQLNYDTRLKELIQIANPLQVQLKRTLWNPTANLR